MGTTGHSHRAIRTTGHTRTTQKTAAKYADQPGTAAVWFRKGVGKSGKEGYTDLDLMVETTDIPAKLLIVESKRSVAAVGTSITPAAIQKILKRTDVYVNKLIKQNTPLPHGGGGFEISGGSLKQIDEFVYEVGESIPTQMEQAIREVLDDRGFAYRIVTPAP